MKIKIINFIGFQVCWFACVFGGTLWAAPLVTLYMLIHTRFANGYEWRLMTAISLIGIAIDMLWHTLGLTAFPDTQSPLIPIWLMLLWLAFSATMLHSLNHFFTRPWLIGLLSMVSAPLSYFAGTRAGAIEITNQGYIAIALEWGVLMFLAALLHQKYHSRLST
ncbi:MAG: DUF2878 domain-containing protein [Oleibacter sp.]|nr:DUF2878 domain-containing protein [Thalassolituus sp.]